MTSLPSEKTEVSVVIPTSLRADLSNAIQSVKAQSVSTEIVVVVDRPAAQLPPEVSATLRAHDQVLHTGGLGAASARNAGVEAARSPWIAFLDDDDEWMPVKLERQLAVARVAAEASQHVVVAAQIYQRWPGHEVISKPVPAEVYPGGIPLADYLFRRRSPTVTRSAIFPSTLLADSGLAKAVKWDAKLPRHQDWDWMIRAASRPDTKLIQIPEALCLVTVGSAGSISATSDWKSSLDWGSETVRAYATAGAYRDFVASQVLRYALQARSPRGVIACLRAFSKAGPPSMPALALGLTGLLSRSSAERAMRIVGARRVRPGGAGSG